MTNLVNPWINYHHLYYFKTIAEEGSVSKAAEKLRLGQPTLSAQLKQFEESLDVLLFERQHKKLILTEQGKIALDYARSIFKLGSEMFEVLHDRLVPSKLSVHIGALDSVAKQVIVQAFSYAYKVTPCVISLLEGKSDELIRELLGHRIDLVVMDHVPAGREGKGLFHRQLSKKAVSIYGAPRFKNLRKDFPRSLNNQPIILPTYDSKLRHDFDHWCTTQNVKLDAIAETQDIGVKKLMATSGIGLIPAASHTVNRQVLAGELVEVGKLGSVYEELVLVTAERRIENPVAAKIMKHFSI